MTSSRRYCTGTCTSPCAPGISSISISTSSRWTERSRSRPRCDNYVRRASTGVQRADTGRYAVPTLFVTLAESLEHENELECWHSREAVVPPRRHR
jgi:hypothetical protein